MRERKNLILDLVQEPIIKEVEEFLIPRHHEGDTVTGGPEAGHIQNPKTLLDQE